MDLRAAVEELRNVVEGVQAIYVFGSVALGQERPDSDVDLAVLARNRLDGEARFRLQEKLAARLGRDVDLVDLRAASTVMQVQVLRTGQVIDDPDPTGRALFEAAVLGAYARLNERRAGIIADAKARGAIHG